MTTFEPVCAASFDSMEYRKKKINTTPLPYLIRPRRKPPVYDSYELYNEFIEYSSLKDGIDSESDDDDDDSSLNAVETSSFEKGNESNASISETDGVSAGSLSDEEYVVVDNVKVLPNSKTERVGAIQMMELSKDTAVAESASEYAGSDNEDAGSNNEDAESGSDSDAWVVL